MKISKDDALQLMKFACAFVWADLKVSEREKIFVWTLAKRLDLDGRGLAKVHNWLELPPKADELDPEEVPQAQRKFFLQIANEVVASDGKIDEREYENLLLFEDILKVR